MESGNNIGLVKFLRRLLIGAIPAMVFCVAILYFALFLRPQMVGDLGELGKIRFDRAYCDSMYRPVLPNGMPLIYQPGDSLAAVVTIGDSFSQQRPNGYQAFLAERIGMPVSNIALDHHQVSPEQAVWDMVNSGFFDSHPAVEWVVVETVEREFISRWLAVDTARTTNHYPVVRQKSPDEGADSRGLAGRIFRQGVDWLKLSAGLADSPVKSVRLDRECFTLPGKEAMLYFYQNDLVCLSATDGEIAEVAARLSALHRRFAARGIGTLFMLAPDKYELYQHLAVDNPYPARPLGSQLLVLDSLGFVVNPLPELSRRLEAGEKDLFMADDSHWSAKSAQTAASLVAAKMLAR